MRRSARLFLVAGAFLAVAATPVAAQQPKAPNIADLFSWFTTAPPDWSAGIFYAVLGAVGALVIVFSLIGGAIPGTAGFTRVEAGMKRVEDREKILDELLTSPAQNADHIKAVEIAVNNLRDDITADRRRQFAIAGLVYIILGAFFAAMIAKDILQALVIGAGWTAYMGALGLKKEYGERKSIKDDVTDRLQLTVKRVLQGEMLTDHEKKQATDLISEASIAKAL